ncbi:MAG TPA: MFS transporter [Bacteroidales bacterium]|nr:MFS transporter [Bacteroidales bacterium]HPO66479.1 MFS transporter [Bacteroidales bacterium]
MNEQNAWLVIKNRNFLLFLIYRSLVTMATLMQSVVVGWHIYKLTGSVFALGMIGLAEVIPQVSIALFAGHFIDLGDRKKIITSTTFILMVGSGLLVTYCLPGVNILSQQGVWPIFITIALTGFSRGILAPAHNALLGQIVPKELYANAATWNSTTWQVAAVIGASLGGLVYGWAGGELPAYATVFTLFILSFFAISLIPSQGKVTLTNNEGIFTRIREGIQFVFNSPILLGAFALDMFAVLFGGAVALLPAFAKDILYVGPQGLGILRAAPSIGAILMGAWLIIHPPLKHTGKTLLWAVTGFGLCIIGFALSRTFWLSVAFLFASGMFDSISVIIRGTLLQIFTPDEMKGRVSAVNSIFIGSSNELGAFESGVAARLMGLVPSVIFGGSMTLVVAAITARINPVLRKLSLRKHKM